VVLGVTSESKGLVRSFRFGRDFEESTGKIRLHRISVWIALATVPFPVSREENGFCSPEELKAWTAGGR
jgi:hypothetical protein